jgi:hypothetical protein
MEKSPSGQTIFLCCAMPKDIDRFPTLCSEATRGGNLAEKGVFRSQCIVQAYTAFRTVTSSMGHAPSRRPLRLRVMRVGCLADFPEPTLGRSELDGPWSGLPTSRPSERRRQRKGRRSLG